MSTLFRERRSNDDLEATALPETEGGKRWWVLAAFFGLMLALMVFSLDAHWLTAGIILIIFIPFFAIAFSWDDFRVWIEATYQFVRSILPWILIGSLGAAIIAGLVPSGLVFDLTGGSSVRSSMISSFLGSLMYLCPPAEVMVTRAFVELGMGLGPALAFILTGPAVSFPSMIILVKIVGWKKSLVYVVMLFVLATLTGFTYGMFFPKGA